MQAAGVRVGTVGTVGLVSLLFMGVKAHFMSVPLLPKFII